MSSDASLPCKVTLAPRTCSALFLVAAAACCRRCCCAAPRTNAPPEPVPPGPPRRCWASLAIAWAVSVVLVRELQRKGKRGEDGVPSSDNLCVSDSLVG